MATNLNVNGVVYRYPQEGDINWAQAATLWATAVTTGMLQKAGGSFPLTADVDFGGSFGVISSYYKSRTSNVAATGQLRLAKTDFIAFRNQANSADLPLGLNLSDQLTFNGDTLLTGATSAITNANIAANAAIALTKLAAVTANRALMSDGSGIITPATATSTELNYLSGVSSAIQTQLDSKLALAGGTMTGPLYLTVMNGLPTQAATKQYVDNAMLGLSPKTPVLVSTTGPGTLAASFEDGQTVDGEVLTTGDRILIKDQVNPVENGIYTVNASGAPTRATDADVWSELVQAYVLTQTGFTNGGAGYLCTASPGGTINVDPVLFIQFSSSTSYTADGLGLELTGTTFSLELDGSTLSKSSSGLRVASSVISDIAAKLPNAMTTTGDLTYSSSGTTPTRLGIGSTGQLLTVVGGVPAWQTFDLNPVTTVVSTNIVLASTDSNGVYLVSSSSGARTITLPAPALGLNFWIKDKDGVAATNNITLIRNSTEQIEGVAASKILQTNWGSWRVISDGTNWFIL